MLPADAVLLDLDGVLVDSRVPFARCFNAALVAHGIEPRPEEELHAFLGPPLHETFASVVAGRASVQACVDAYRRRYVANAAAETPVFPGMAEVVKQLAADVPVVVATSKPRALAEPLLEALGLREQFLAVVGPSLDAENEPKARTVELALERLPDAARPVMVGDRRFDIAAARANQIGAVGVLWGIGSERELSDAGAQLLVRTPAELLGVLRAT